MEKPKIRQLLAKLDRLLDRHVDGTPGATDFTEHQAMKLQADFRILCYLFLRGFIDREIISGRREGCEKNADSAG